MERSFRGWTEIFYSQDKTLCPVLNWFPPNFEVALSKLDFLDNIWSNIAYLIGNDPDSLIWSLAQTLRGVSG
jgi:hypothetical protein